MHFLLPFFKWCDSTWLGETIRGSRIYFPIIETFHLLALTILFGAVLVLNLRMCGLMMKTQPVQQVAKENGYTYVFLKDALLVSPPAEDLLPLVKKKLGLK